MYWYTDKETKYAENQRRASLAYYNRQKQIKLDGNTARLLYDLINTDEGELEELWPETFKILVGINQ